MRIYDLVIVLRSSLSEDKKKKLTDTIKSWAKDSKITKEEDLGKKSLSYPIKKEVSGSFQFFTLESETGIAQDFEKKLLAQEDVLRHLLVRTK